MCREFLRQENGAKLVSFILIVDAVEPKSFYSRVSMRQDRDLHVC
jgi:hypothetical protein